MLAWDRERGPYLTLIFQEDVVCTVSQSPNRRVVPKIPILVIFAEFGSYLYMIFLENHASVRLWILNNCMIDIYDYMMPDSLGFLLYEIDTITVVA